MPAGKSGKKIFVISMNAITSEAQNALLKLLEEPAEYAHFFLIIPSSHLLLPTVKSRLSFIGSGSSALTNGYSDEAKIFVISSIAKRLEQIKKLAEEITKEKKTRHDAIELLDAIQAVVFEERGPKEGEQALSCIETARKYINDRSPSVKMLLEHVALNI